MPELTQAERFSQAARAQERSKGRNWKKLSMQIAGVLGALYILMVLALYIFQKRIVYHPAVSDSSSLEVKAFGFAPRQAEDISTATSDGVTLHGWRIMSATDRGKLADARSVILFFTGKGGNRSYHDAKFRRLAAIGGEVVCFDYRGYGDNEGSPDEEGLGRDARAAWEYLTKAGVKPESIVLYGESLGSAVATRLAWELSKEHTPPAGMLLEGSFPRLLDPAQHLFFWVPVSLILNQYFPSAERIPSVECPVLFVHGAHDRTVPIEQGRALFAAAPPRARGVDKTFVECPNSNHTDMDVLDAQIYEDALKTFLGAALPRSEHAPAQKRERRKGEFKHVPAPPAPANDTGLKPHNSNTPEKKTPNK